ncbi:translation initiation factor IF-2 [Kordiimonas sp. SCSIO 12610]|uniref:translation initiation factor IF-2 n=1 Tax=Kordiimonas sp. SCSIO 12610 TaxID=2829597 RepID=UPI00210EBD3A|nr:translation initiation factor IF-2 [Kordiimonas sp. SCSIO 12610]UTW55100.1 translation initiation factor IF-2 [Kordiimonas sp. SCSIO 12610]
MSDDKKLTLSGRTTLGVGKGVETGQVRQNFSHGRSKAVVVERKKKRILTKGGAAAGSTPAETKPVAPKQTKSFTPKKPASPSGTTLTDAEMEKRAKVLGEAKIRAEAEAKEKAALEAKRAKEEAERKMREAAEAAARSEEDNARAKAEADAKKKAEAAAKQKAEAEAEKRLAEQKAAKEKAEAEAKKKADLEARAVQLRKASEARQASGGGDAQREERKGKPKRAKDRKNQNNNEQQNRRGRGGDDRRKGGRLSISNVGGEERQRSLASYKRMQAKKMGLAGNAGPSQPKQSREITVPEAISVQDLANRMAEKATSVLKTLMKLGVIATINETLDQDTAELVIEEFGHTAKRVSEADVEIGLVGEDDREEDLSPRAPIVTVMGHVDHGKTSLLDALRKANVVSGEAGGITQHIGAYQVAIDKDNKITFLDTPGHAAFTQMRARGASVTDIVVLVVAGDDGVMPQTIEAINHAKAAGVPLIVAINKMDREGANPDRVRQELLQHEVVVETFQGDTQEVEVSAITGMGLDKLKEALGLQAEILELKANPDRAAEGVVVEAKLDKGRGPVATVLVQRGTLKIGDIFVAGAEWGKVRALINDKGAQVKEAGPSVPVEVLGLNGTPGAGDDFAVVENEARAREVTAYRQDQALKKRQAAMAAPKTLESIFSKIKDDEGTQYFDVVLKGDVQGSVEAITQALQKAGNDDIQCRVIHGAVGGITETDIALAQASNALIMGFNVRPSRQAREAAETEGVTIKYYSIIYDLIDEVKAAMIGQLGPEFKENVIGQADIKEAFTAGKAGKAAGCFVIEGSIRRDCKARILRDDVIIYEGEINNLRRFKDDVNEVRSGQDCGMTFENYHDFRAGDVVEVYELLEVERKL